MKILTEYMLNPLMQRINKPTIIYSTILYINPIKISFTHQIQNFKGISHELKSKQQINYMFLFSFVFQIKKELFYACFRLVISNALAIVMLLMFLCCSLTPLQIGTFVNSQMTSYNCTVLLLYCNCCLLSYCFCCGCFSICCCYYYCLYYCFFFIVVGIFIDIFNVLVVVVVVV